MKKNLASNKFWQTSWGALCFLAFLFFFPVSAKAATLTVTPSTGSFTVGSTFSVSVYLNSEGETVNTVGTTLLYPADRLQLVSPSTGNSIITLWTAVPVVNNAEGKIVLQGGIPNGIKIEKGLVTTLNFRVKSVGTGYLKFADASKVLLNDGKGSDVLRQINNAVFTLILPPPAGPVVASPTHPDQSTWYNQKNVLLSWGSLDPVDSYSYVLSDDPIDFPDDIPESKKNAIEYRNLSDGIHYFHIKALHANLWGGVSHFAVKIDSTPPADFPIEIIPGVRTTRLQPLIQFLSTDALSGIDHYELSIIPLRIDSGSPVDETINTQPLFIEATSPYIPPQLKFGSYDVVIKAYDAAQNVKQTSTRLTIVSALFTFVSNDGITFRSNLTIKWRWIFLGLLFIILALIYGITKIRHWHNRVHEAHTKKVLPDNLQDQLAELKRYRSKYGMLVLAVFFVAAQMFSGSAAAISDITATPPVITSFSDTITNNEILYVGGKSDTPKSSVIVYIQNLQSGETISQTTESDMNGNWFYRHNSFLPSGDYRIWLQSKHDVVLSPPSPEQTLHVRTGAIQIGVSRLSIEALYFIITILALFIILILALYILVHGYRARAKHVMLKKEVREAEESVKRGFAILKHDIQNQLETIHKAKLSKEISEEEAQKEKQLLSDLESVENFITKEVWDIEKVDSANKE